MTKTTPAEHWRRRIAEIDARIEKQKTQVAAAESDAAKAVANGEELNIGVSLPVLLAELKALEAGRVSALEELDRVIAAEASIKAEAELKLANKAARDRHVAASELDEALTQVETAWLRFLGAGVSLRSHLMAADRPAPSHAKMAAGEAVRGALMYLAPTFARTLMVSRTIANQRVPLASIAAIQTPWKDSQ